jgi:predicted Zn-dependent peptidase
LKYYRPNNSYLAIIGNFDQAYLEKVKSQFAGWKRKEIPAAEEIKMVQASGLEVRVKTKEGLQQAQLLLGHSGISRRHPDYLKARIANEILGGDFVSRLNQRLRVELGLTYGASSSFDVRESAGAFIISTFTKNESVEQSIEEVRKVLKEFAESGVNEEELAAAKAQYQGQFPHLIETADSFAQTVMILKYYGISPDYLATVIEKVKSLKVAEINQTIKTLIHPDDLKVVVFTDKKALGKQLSSLNPIFVKDTP